MDDWVNEYKQYKIWKIKVAVRLLFNKQTN